MATQIVGRVGASELVTESGERIVFVDADGNVGIGTEEPDALLEVSAESGAEIRITSTDTAMSAGESIGRLEFYGNDATAPGAGIKAEIRAVAVAVAGDDAALDFYVSNGTTNLVRAMRIAVDGKVGIGTATPARKLDVESNSFAAFIGTDDDGIAFYNQSGRADIIGINRALNSFNNLWLRAGTSGGIYVNTSGKVGIGVEAPARSLHVKDYMRLTPISAAPSTPAAGDIYFDSDDNKLKCYDGTLWQDCF